MGKRKQSSNGFKLPEALIQARVDLASSGASGVHDDQNARRRAAAGRVNRTANRRNARRMAASDGW